MFFDTGSTQFDLRFRLFGTAVRVSPWFWVIMAAMGWGGGPGRDPDHFIERLVIWVACAFVSILVHEFGHVFAGRLFGSEGHIVLYGMGGLAIGSSALERRWQRIVVYAAGPAAGFLLLALVWGGVYLSGVTDEKMPRMAAEAFRSMVWINLVWGLVNLLPIYPLDGGQISRDVCEGLGGAGGVRLSLGISTFVAGAIAAHALAMELSGAYVERVIQLVLLLGRWSIFLLGLGGWYVAIFFGMLALSSFATLQQLERQQRQQREWDDHWDD